MKIVVLSGSARTGSVNRKVAGIFEEDGSFTDGANLDAVAGLMTRLVAALQCTGAEDRDARGSLSKASGTTGQ